MFHVHENLFYLISIAFSLLFINVSNTIYVCVKNLSQNYHIEIIFDRSIKIVIFGPILDNVRCFQLPNASIELLANLCVD